MVAAKTILVIGSSNTDMVIKTQKFPSPGETLLGGEFFLFPGGKGANQAVAAARLGGDVTLIAKVGKDIFGEQAIEQFKKEKINTEVIVQDPVLPSGVALITVDAEGENTIVVAQGSNGNLSSSDIQFSSSAFGNCEILLMQLEIPIATVLSAASEASKLGKKVILNPAPAAKLPDELYSHLFLITPNETEAETLTGIKIQGRDSLLKAAHHFREKGVENVVITLGAEGAYVHDEQGGKNIPAPKVKPIDTTAAGDIFNGALAVALCEGKSLEEAVLFANQCAAMSVTRMGAQSSAPYRKEIETLSIKS